ncbi:MAG: ATP-dependent RecD-like DNA helicase [Proteobacteria bacterium]|nr:ATP-dependent RecD-like DNA helicase [Desulfobacteraceae bacterium]MBU3979805.1 ATP-dependent RecD-like DNA helicase [Pseudomonadota bacterium]MBU4014377.1 ATP-dependent RecD-like DNA helicase [Pseudomonadota bacterium]MBU4068437.1 ATP-dependent RecD-like DNA helicase [Pseudomonadota bacterium]MBU4100304.1 ATP-dependent RecD-like DNA helicase [Pseudomonadota bacterium]
MTYNLTGQIERITYSNEENGFTIARVKVSGRRDLVTVVGNLMSPMPGEIIKMQGEWTSHPKYGEQFKLVRYKTSVPATVYGIQKYLGSGLIRGIGPVMAGRIVKKYGKNSLDIIENEIEKLAQVDGIGKKRIEMIRTAWDEQKEIRDVMLFLQTHGVSSGYATKIFRQYGNQSIAVVQENPYRLAADIFGIGFVIADGIAEKLGFSKDSTLRAEAGIQYVLHQMADEGNVYYPYELLLEKCREILQIDREVIAKALGSIVVDKKIIIEDLNDNIEEFRENNKAVYLEKYYVCETRIAFRLKTLIGAPKSFRDIDLDRAVEWVQKQLFITLAEKQLEALRCSVENKVVVITGGPGTGKTTIINAVIKIFSRMKLKIMLAAPTGRAAKRMSETTGYEARTIHRLLEFSFQKGGFQKNDKKPLDCDLLIIDEASMIDTILMHHLLKAIPPRATFILVGDVNQLPSVGAGAILNDIIESGSVPVVELNEIFRQAKDSRIIVNAHKINSGIIPDFKTPTPSDYTNDFYFIQQEDPEKVLEIILELLTDRIPRRFNFDPVDDIQVLTPMHKGVVGAGNLNEKLQEALNPGENIIIRGDRGFRVNDKVMQIRNNYDKEVFNGDIGKIARIIADEQALVISFDGREVGYEFADLDEIVLAYAVSVHKSQGSEYPAVIIPILIQHYMLLQRNLIYTAVTRGRSLVVMVGTKKALAIGINNNKTQKRYTYLKHRL